MIEYKSSVLKCKIEDHDCAVCRFLDDRHTIQDMLEVIELLDSKLAVKEDYVNNLLNCLLRTV